MIRDARTTFGAPVLLNTGLAGSYFIGDVIDLTTTGRDVGAGEGVGDIFVYVAVAAAATSGGAATLQVQLVTSDDANLSTPTVIASSASAIPLASLTNGAVLLAVRLPSAVYKRYIGIQQTTGTAAFTGGSVYAYLAEDVNAIRFYPQGFAG